MKTKRSSTNCNESQNSSSSVYQKTKMDSIPWTRLFLLKVCASFQKTYLVYSVIFWLFQTQKSFSSKVCPILTVVCCNMTLLKKISLCCFNLFYIRFRKVFLFTYLFLTTYFVSIVRFYSDVLKVSNSSSTLSECIILMNKCFVHNKS